MLPQQGGGYTVGGEDPLRPAQDVIGVVALAPAVARVKGAGSEAGANAQIRVVAETVKFSTDELPYPVHPGDLIELSARPKAPTYKVSRTAPDGWGRTVLFLVAVGQS